MKISMDNYLNAMNLFGGNKQEAEKFIGATILMCAERPLDEAIKLFIFQADCANAQLAIAKELRLKGGDEYEIS